MTKTLTRAEASVLTTEVARIENALITLTSGALADYLLTNLPGLAAIDAIDTSDDEGPSLYVTSTYGSDISDDISPDAVMDYLGNHGISVELAGTWHGHVNLLEAVTAARALLSQDATCRHCGQGIAPDVDNDWIHTESEGVTSGRPVNDGDDDTYTAEPSHR